MTRVQDGMTTQDLATRMELKFGSEEMLRAYREWGCNCGPAALAVALGRGLDRALELIPEFPSRKYTSPTMMSEALDQSRVSWKELTRSRNTPASLCPDCLPEPGLVRVQWTGPWTQPGANPRWAYRQTHWFASFRFGDEWAVFDVNSGPVVWAEWLATIPKAITSQIPRADGGWFITHLWQLSKEIP